MGAVQGPKMNIAISVSQCVQRLFLCQTVPPRSQGSANLQQRNPHIYGSFKPWQELGELKATFHVAMGRLLLCLSGFCLKDTQWVNSLRAPYAAGACLEKSARKTNLSISFPVKFLVSIFGFIYYSNNEMTFFLVLGFCFFATLNLCSISHL